MRQLSPKTLDILTYIKRYQQTNGYTPSVREIAERFVLASPSTAKYHLDRLEAYGYIERKVGQARSIKVTEKA